MASRLLLPKLQLLRFLDAVGEGEAAEFFEGFKVVARPGDVGREIDAAAGIEDIREAHDVGNGNPVTRTGIEEE